MDLPNPVNHGSKIFSNFRTLGQIAGDIPCLTRYIHTRRENFIISCIGKSFHTFRSQGLQLLTTSPPLGETITTIAVDTYHVYTACGKNIYAWRRGFELKHVYECEDRVLTLLTFAPHLLALDVKGVLWKWNVVSGDVTLKFELESYKISPTLIMHPATYINKVLVGTDEGIMLLVNIRTAKVIYIFQSFNSSIRAIVQTPAVDVVGIALKDKRILLHNLRIDVSIMRFDCLEDPVSLAFRMDGQPTLLSGSQQGNISVWDLEKRLLICHIKGTHDGPVMGLQCLPQESIFVTSSPDNSIKLWSFDMPDGSFRLLMSRESHSQPSNCLRFFGTDSQFKYLLSSSEDRSLRIFHIYNETYNRCISRKKRSKQDSRMRNFLDTSGKMSPISCFTTQTVASPSHHEDVAAYHLGQVGISTWSFANTARGSKTLMLPKYVKNLPLDVVATCITMTACCQFVVAGYSDGTIERFNIQSGLHRKTYKPNTQSLPEDVPADVPSVRGVAVDQMNDIILSGDALGHLVFWDFKSGEMKSQIEAGSGINFICHRSTDLFAGVVLDDFVICVMNLSTRRIFRRFIGIQHPVTCASFTPDNKWLTASSSDRLLRTWDITTGDLIDVIRIDSIVSSMDYSPTGEYLAGSYCDQNGIFVWTNRTLYERISLLPLAIDYVPSNVCSTGGHVEDDAMVTTLVYESPEQIEKNLLTLSLLPNSRWKNLLNLDTIKMRNRPQQPPTNYVAPFFLQGSVSRTAPPTSDEPHTSSRILQRQLQIEKANFAKTLLQFKVHDEPDELCQILSEMGPSEIDLEFRNFASDVEDNNELILQFLIFATELCQRRRNFENGQAYIALFLKIHGETLHSNKEFEKALAKLEQVLPLNHIQDKLNNVLKLLEFAKVHTLG